MMTVKEDAARQAAQAFGRAADRLGRAAEELEEALLLNRRDGNPELADLLAEARRKVDELGDWLEEASEC